MLMVVSKVFVRKILQSLTENKNVMFLFEYAFVEVFEPNLVKIEKYWIFSDNLNFRVYKALLLLGFIAFKV